MPTRKPLNEMQHKKDKKRIGGKSASEKKVLKDLVAEESLGVIRNIGYICQAHKEHAAEKIEGGDNRLPHVRQKFSQCSERQLNRSSILVRIQSSRRAHAQKYLHRPE